MGMFQPHISPLSLQPIRGGRVGAKAYMDCISSHSSPWVLQCPGISTLSSFPKDLKRVFTCSSQYISSLRAFRSHWQLPPASLPLPGPLTSQAGKLVSALGPANSQGDSVHPAHILVEIGWLYSLDWASPGNKCRAGGGWGGECIYLF